MPTPLSRADFCRLSLTGLVGVACQRSEAPQPTRQAPAAVTAAAATTPETAPTPAPPPTPSALASATGSITKRKLGSTGVEVSMLGLGGAHIVTKTSTTERSR